MDEDAELKKLKWLLIAVVIFLCSAYFSYWELKYMIWGQIAEARIERVSETLGTGRRGRRPMLKVEYTFTDSVSGSRTERDEVSLDWQVPQGTVNVQYLPGVAHSSRLEDHSSLLSVWIFFGSLIAIAGFVFYLALESEGIPKKRRRR